MRSINGAAVGRLRNQPRILRFELGLGGMLSSISRVAIPLAAAVLVLQACADAGTRTSGEVSTESPASNTGSPESAAPITQVYPPADIVERFEESEADWPIALADSLERMTATSDMIIVGRAVDVKVGYPFSGFIQSHFGEPSETPPPGHPKPASDETPDPSGKIGPVGSWYTIEVVQVLRGAVSPGELITVTQLGGVADGVIHERADDPLISIPTTYLFFLTNPKPDTFTGSPFGRFEVRADVRLQTVNAEIWGWLPAVAELNGSTVDAAVDQVTTAIAQLPASTAAP